jgi:hypothetical protein
MRGIAGSLGDAQSGASCSLRARSRSVDSVLYYISRACLGLGILQRLALCQGWHACPSRPAMRVSLMAAHGSTWRCKDEKTSGAHLGSGCLDVCVMCMYCNNQGG